VTLHREGDLPSALLAGSAWFWGARLAAGALLSSGVGVGPAEALSWVGVAGAGRVFARLALAGRWATVTAAAVLVVLPEAIVMIAGRVGRAAVGLRTDWGALGADVTARLLVSAGTLVAATAACAVVGLALTSARRRSPT
jgi:hypothetical protein